MNAQIGVITPYEGQRAFIVNNMARNGSLRQQLYKEIEVLESLPFPHKNPSTISLARS